MEDFYNSTLIDDIRAQIKSNTNRDISGDKLQQYLLKIVNALDLGGIFLGFATTSTNPSNEGKSKANGFYFSTGAGIYSNFIGENNQAIVVGSSVEVIYRDVVNETLVWKHQSISVDPNSITSEEITDIII